MRALLIPSEYKYEDLAIQGLGPVYPGSFFASPWFRPWTVGLRVMFILPQLERNRVCPRNCYAHATFIPSIKARDSASEHSGLDRNDALCPDCGPPLLRPSYKLAANIRLGQHDGSRLYLASSDALEPLVTFCDMSNSHLKT